MIKYYILFLLSFVIVSCKKSSSDSGISGNYAGTFTRTTGIIDSTTGITMNFTGDRFSGSSSVSEFPGICEGSFGMIGDSISFGNDCEVPGDYKNSTRLYGKYGLIMKNDSLIFSRAFGDFIYEADFYRLKKQ
jgi:hypothetical protein